MKYPNFLKSNGKIGVCAPSFGAWMEPYLSRLDNAIKKFNKLNHNVVLTSSVKTQDGIASSDALTRAKEFTSLYLNKDIDVIISEAGGEVEYEILSYLDFDKLNKATPKWFEGYSDNTNLVFLLTTLCDVSSIYGIHFPDFGMKKWHKSVTDTYKLLKGEKFEFESFNQYEVESNKYELGHYLDSYNITIKDKVSCLTNQKEVNLKGRVLVGCLDVLVTLVGTKYDKVKEFNDKYKDDGIIFFLESCDLNVVSQQRALFQLKNAGWFNNCKGIVIGRPLNKKELFSLDYKSANLKELKDLNIPVIIDVSFGHLSPVIPIISGSIANIKYKNGKFKINYELE